MILDDINMEYEGIKNTILGFTNEYLIKSYLNKIEIAKKNSDMKNLKILFHKIEKWYEENINKIYADPYTCDHHDEHEKVMLIIKDICNKLNQFQWDNIFIIHGHDDTLKLEVVSLLEKLKLRPIVLHEQANKGLTIIEKFEAYSNVSIAISLLTPDDIGGKDKNNLGMRARQNVIFETGFFIGKLGRNNVINIVKDIEVPSDLSGLSFINFKENWERDLIRELQELNVIDRDMVLT